MKVRSANRQPWPRLLAQRFATRQITDEIFHGQVTLLCMDRVREPLVVESHEKSLCICDTGYSWLQHFPTQCHYTVTTQFDAAGTVVQWYIDICAQHGVDAAGIPWWQDLYLDLIVMPDGQQQIVDGDELDEALHAGIIDCKLHALAWREAHAVAAQIEQGRLPLLQRTMHHREQLLAML